MSSLPYDDTSKDSIYQYASQLEGKTLRDFIATEAIDENILNKGSFGQLLEKYYFLKELDSISQPDFPKAELELKSAGLKTLKKGHLRAKERLVLNIINYEDIVFEEFNSSSVYTKNRHMLLIFYNYIKDLLALDYMVKLIGLWSFPPEDLKVIKHDWELIKQKVESGQAHTLSEGDTFYLGACTKGANARSLRTQPNSSELAKQRAFSLKAGYVNHIIAKIADVNDGSIGKIITAPELNQKEVTDIEALIIKKFEPYLNKSPDSIADMLNVAFNDKAKNRFAVLTKNILGASSNQVIEEFEKADVTVKTIRIGNKQLPCENVSFPAFSYIDLAKEEDWSLSELNQILEKKFLFVFYKLTDNGLILEKAKFWNMPYQDRQEAMKAWNTTKETINSGKIVKSAVPGKRRYTYFPNKSENRVVHVRPHANNTDDTYPLPKPDELTKVKSYMKHSFWLNDTYIRDSIYR